MSAFPPIDSQTMTIHLSDGRILHGIRRYYVISDLLGNPVGQSRPPSPWEFTLDNEPIDGRAAMVLVRADLATETNE